MSHVKQLLKLSYQIWGVGPVAFALSTLFRVRIWLLEKRSFSGGLVPLKKKIAITSENHNIWCRSVTKNSRHSFSWKLVPCFICKWNPAKTKVEREKFERPFQIATSLKEMRWKLFLLAVSTALPVRHELDCPKGPSCGEISCAIKILLILYKQKQVLSSIQLLIL